MTEWRACFLIDPDTGGRPAMEFLAGLTDKDVAKVLAVVRVVRDAPPPAFSGGGKWEAMHDDMAGIYEVRTRHGQRLHRLFCLLDRSTASPSIVMLNGGTKPNNRKMAAAIYEEADRLRQLYLAAVAKGRGERLLDCSF